MNETDVRKLAALCRIELTDDEVDKLQKDMESILGYVGEIGEVVAEIGVPKAGALHNVMRKDGEPHEPGAYTNTLVGVAPQHEDGHVKVKSIL